MTLKATQTFNDTRPASQADALDQFNKVICEFGLEPQDALVADDKIHRVRTAGERNGKQSGWYRFYSDEPFSGSFGSHKLGAVEKWTAGRSKPLTDTEREEQEQRRKQREADQEQTKGMAKARAIRLWARAQPAQNHPYLAAKQVGAYGVRHVRNILVVPVRDFEKNLQSLQFIRPDGTKRFLKDAPKGGYFHLIGKPPKNTVIVAEGYATGASLHEATGYSVVVAFDAGNLLIVAQTVRAKFPEHTIIIAADNDAGTAGNPGVTKATEAATAVGADIAIPRFKDVSEQPTDFNDLARQEGLDAVQQAIQGARSPTVSTLSARTGDHAETTRADVEETWSQPQPIVAELSPVEPLPFAIIPAPYRAWIEDVSERMQTPPDFLATASIVVTASVIGTACTLKPKRHDDWQVIPNLWGGAIGRPSVLLKTPAMREGLNPLARLELEAKQLFDAEQQRYDADVEMHKAKREAIKHRMKQAVKKSASDIDDLKFELSTLTSPDAPVWRRYKTNDSTIEKCNELMRDNPRGLLLFRDELVGLLAGWEKPGHESDRAYFLEGWNGNQGHTDDRIGRGTTYAENVCISLYGGIQPAKLQTYLYQCMRGLQNDGLVQRLQLAVYPDEPKSWQLVDRYPDTNAKNRVYNIIEKLAKGDFTDYGANLDESDKFPSLRFADDAQALFYEWLIELQDKLRAEDEPVVLEHLGKYRSLMPSLALIFHLINIADGSAAAGPVRLETAELAAAWCDYLESHARRIYGLVSNANTQAAATLAKKVRASKLNDGFTVRDVYRQKWHLLTDREAAQCACDELVAQGWLREQVTAASFGQRAKVTYLINPQVGAR